MVRLCLLLFVLLLSHGTFSTANAFVPEMAPPHPRESIQRKMRRDSQLEKLFLALKASPDARLSSEIASQILKIWNEPEGDTVKILAQRVQEALRQQDQKTARQLLDKIVELEPRYFQARYERSKIFFQNNEYYEAMIDLNEVLRREPRHFDALVGAGMILMNTGHDEKSLLLFEIALSINRHIQNVPNLVRTLSEKVQGLPI